MVEAFRRLGHKVIVVSPPGVDPFANSEKKSQSLGLARTLKWFSKNAPEIIFELSELLYNFWAYKKMYSLIKKERFDFIYERYALNAFAGLKISEKYGIPLILEVNDSAMIERVRKLKAVGIAKSNEKKIFNGATAIVTISSYFKEIIIESNISSDKVYVIPNAIDESKLGAYTIENPEKEQYAKNGETIIGYVGSFLQWHGVDLLLESFEVLLNKGDNAKLLLVGDGLTLAAAKSLARTNRLTEHVVFTGNVPHSDISSCIKAMDICVIPDSNDYGSPMKLFEYMGAGKPVVAPRLSPMEDVIRSGENGVLFKQKDKGELSAILDILIGDNKMRDRIGRSARDTVLQNHTWTKNAEKVLRIYKGKRWN
jgi:glycosyltransferase involved in cell wall biosynthesis